ncbi:HNH endonuclease [Paenibacillus psychroresistens]|uniref:HNH endonuclease n=1 Tax=Paenibacillus psychroresistens TaxID=1778678 RepID=A0A6B8RL35_9BACL|nr:HNH endonuclease [Paenibacillus psychroresistens]QGQ97020.1 HNH endonuclease [Paenibacillus psychroresistens]
MSLMKEKMFLCGDYVNAYQCDQCEEERCCSFQHWADKNFTLCSKCLEAAYKELFQIPLPGTSKKKKKISVRLRLAIFKRDSYKCKYCGYGEDLEADHVVPESRGGETSIDNLVTACKVCNQKKGARTPEEANMKLMPLSR